MAQNNQEKILEATKDKQTGHDESVLNPVYKNESDLSRKEKRLLEKEKLKGMGPGKKLQYIWMYYKPVMFGILAAIVLAFVLRDWYINAKTKTVLSIAAVNSQLSDTDDIEKQVEELLGVTEDKYSKVQISVNITTDETGGNLDYYAQTAYMTQVQAGTLDIMLMPEQLYDSLNTDGIFLNLEELLGDHVFGEFGTQSDQTHITIKDSRLAEEFGLSYDSITIVVPASAPNQKNAAKWMESLISEE